MKNWLLLTLSIGVFFESLTFGLYLSIVRPYMEYLGSPYTLIFMVDFVWAIIGLTSIFWGYLSDKIGKKLVVPIGTLGFIPLYLMSKTEDPILIIVYTGLYSLFYTISQPSILAIVSYSERVGKAFAIYTISSSIGWGLGSVLMGFIHDVLNLGARGVFLWSSVSWTLGFILLVLTSQKLEVVSEERVRFHIPESIRFIFIVELLAYTGLNWYFPLITLKIHEILGGNKLVYGIVWGALPTITGLIISPYAGKLSESIGGVRVVRIALLIYTIILPLLAVSTGYYTLILWLTPAWPLHYVGINVAISQLSKSSERGEAMGAINTCYNLGMILAIIGGGIADVIGRDYSMILATIPVALAFFLINMYIKKSTRQSL